MKRVTLVFVCMLSWFFLCAQNVQWTWISGDSTGNQVDVYGDRRNFDPVNKPGGLIPLNTWTDKAGNFYMFGGGTLAIRFGFDTIPVYTNALWKYKPAINAWAMITGSNSTVPAMSGGGGFYGTPGVPGPDNTPQRLERSGATWMDTSGNWWMFGGKVGYRFFGTISELWKFNPVIGQWTYVRNDGNDVVPSYGIKGVPALSNTPGARRSMLTWTDHQGNLYFYGGYREIDFTFYGDVWKYDPIINLWTWVSGRQGNRSVSDGPVYGTKGVFATDNTPGTFSVADRFLGQADLNGVVQMYISSELWNYSVKTNEWAWISGDRTIPNTTPVPKRNYGTKGVPSADNHPGPRSGTFNWTDTAGNQWRYGGYLSTGSSSGYFLNDLWKYTLKTGHWVWVDGDSSINRPPDFGTKGITSASTQPGGRSGSVTWRDAEGNMWLFGGNRLNQQPSPATGPNSRLNDLWKLSVTTVNAPLPVQISTFSAVQRTNGVALNWSTSQEQNSKEFVIQRSSDGLHFTTIGMVAASGNTSSVSHYGFVDEAPLTGSNFYRLKQVDLNNTSEYSRVLKVMVETPTFAYRIIQNPVQNELRLTLQTAHATSFKIQVKDATGRLLIIKNIKIAQGTSTYSLPVKGLTEGVYIISVANNQKVITKRFFKS